MITKFWKDETGAILSAELVLIMTILVIGLVAGLTEVRNAVSAELSDVSGAFRGLNQSYRIYAVGGSGGISAPSGFDELPEQQDRQDRQNNRNTDKQAGITTCASIFGSSPIIENNVYVSNVSN